MSIMEPIWWEYATFDDEGELTNELSADATPEAKQAFEEYLKERAENPNRKI